MGKTQLVRGPVGASLSKEKVGSLGRCETREEQDGQRTIRMPFSYDLEKGEDTSEGIGDSGMTPINLERDRLWPTT